MYSGGKELADTKYKIQKEFPPEVDREPEFQFFSEAAIARATKWVVIGIGLLFIIVPMLVLQLAIDDNESNLRAGITAAFVGTFMIFMTAFTLARPAEILAATAGLVDAPEKHA